MFQMLDKIDCKLRERVERIADTALQFGDAGVVEMLQRAVDDALFLGRLRDKDAERLARLEETYNHDFYRNRGSAERNTIYA